MPGVRSFARGSISSSSGAPSVVDRTRSLRRDAGNPSTLGALGTARAIGCETRVIRSGRRSPVYTEMASRASSLALGAAAMGASGAVSHRCALVCETRQLVRKSIVHEVGRCR